ncbi:MAG: LapA family protein [Isosphaeraceae bacterium]
MRVIYTIFLFIILGAIGLFALQNFQTITLKFANWSISCPVPLLVIIVYLLGMVSGWTVLGLMRRSIQRATAHSSD